MGLRLNRWFSLIAAWAVIPLAQAQESVSAVPSLRSASQLESRAGQHREDAPVFIEAESLTGQAQEFFQLDGQAEIRRPGMVIKGNRLRYDQVEDEVEAEGGVRILHDGLSLSGPRLRMNLVSGTGLIEEAAFQYAPTGGRGQAESLELLGNKRARARGVRYTGCDCEAPAWELRASRVDFDYNTDVGVGYGSVLYFKGVPILGAPVLSFPLSDARKSGFLSPTFGLTSKSGLEFQLPYYVNIAPNRDLTLYPRYMQRRGWQLGGEFRYLGADYAGQTSLFYLPDDRRAHRDRYLLRSQHQHRLGDRLRLDWNVNKASDDAYFRDLSAVGTGQSSTATLERSLTLSWNEEYWSAFGRVVNYQTLQDPLAPIVPPYAREPQLHLTGARYDVNGFDLRFDADLTRFSAPTQQQRSGSRAFVQQTVSYPVIRPGGFFIPTVKLHAAQYHNDSFQGQASGNQSLVVPVMSLDSGLVFERETDVMGEALTQTLEPRLYYLRVPRRNQLDLPIYDTALADFNFAQIFSDNLYVGNDRYAEANQLTAALSTRWLDPKTGQERARITGAQRIYFGEHEPVMKGETPRSGGRSDFLLSVYGALTSTLSGETTIQYNPDIDRVTRSTIGFRWHPKRLSTLSVAYRYKRPDVTVTGQELLDVAFQWPLARNVFGIGRINYSLQENRIAESVAGIEYVGNCCWAARVVAQRYAVARQNATTAMFFQLELTGFGGIGNNPITTLRRTIPGYQLVNPTPARETVFERYE